MADGLQINEELVKKYAELVREWSALLKILKVGS